MESSAPSSYKLVSFHEKERSDCWISVFGSLLQILPMVIGIDVSLYFDGRTLIYISDERDPEHRIALVDPYKSEWVHLYFSRSGINDAIRFDGALYPEDPSLIIARGCSEVWVDAIKYMSIPCGKLAGIEDLANAVRRLPGTLRWGSQCCYIYFKVLPDIESTRASKEEIITKIRHRIYLYKMIDRDAEESITRAMLDSACSVSTERQAAVDWLTVFIMGICFAVEYKYFLSNECTLFRRRMELQADSPDARACTLECNKYSRTFAIACAEQPEADFVNLVVDEHYKAMIDLQAIVTELTRMEDPIACDKSIEMMVASAVQAINESMKD